MSYIDDQYNKLMAVSSPPKKYISSKVVEQSENPPSINGPSHSSFLEPAKSAIS